MLNEVKRIRIDVPQLNVETNIVIYQVNEEDKVEPGKEKYVGLIYRRGGAELEWSFAGRTIESHDAARAEMFARDWHRENLGARSSRKAPQSKRRKA
jgi:hypothetical protein